MTGSLLEGLVSALEEVHFPETLTQHHCATFVLQSGLSHFLCWVVSMDFYDTFSGPTVRFHMYTLL